MRRLMLCALLGLAAGPHAAEAAEEAQVVAAVGERTTVLEQDIKDWQTLQACYGEDALVERKAAFMRQLEASIGEEVLSAHAGVRLKPEEYQAELERVDRETQAPDILACIKKYFGKDTGRYGRVFLRPVMVNRHMGNFLSSHPTAQGKAFELRDQAKSRLGKDSFEAIARDLGVRYSSATYSMEASTAAPAGPGPGWSPFEPYFIEQHLKGLEIGQASPPIETGYHIQFARLLEKDGGRYRFESILIEKRGQAAVFAELPKLRCEIRDAALREWTRGIRGNPWLEAVEIP